MQEQEHASMLDMNALNAAHKAQAPRNL